MHQHDAHIQLIRDLTTRAAQSADNSAMLQYPFPSAHAAQSFRFKFYKWRQRNKGVPFEAHHITLSLSNNSLIAIFDPKASVLPRPIDAFPISAPPNIEQLPEHLRSLIQRTEQPTTPIPLSGEVSDPMSEMARKLYRDDE